MHILVHKRLEVHLCLSKIDHLCHSLQDPQQTGLLLKIIHLDATKLRPSKLKELNHFSSKNTNLPLYQWLELTLKIKITTTKTRSKLKKAKSSTNSISHKNNHFKEVQRRLKSLSLSQSITHLAHHQMNKIMDFKTWAWVRRVDKVVYPVSKMIHHYLKVSFKIILSLNLFPIFRSRYRFRKNQTQILSHNDTTRIWPKWYCIIRWHEWPSTCCYFIRGTFNVKGEIRIR